MPKKTTVEISDAAHRELLKIQLERKLQGEKNVTISSLASEYLDRALNIPKDEKPAQT